MKVLRLTTILVLTAFLFTQCTDELREQTNPRDGIHNQDPNAYRPELPSSVPGASLTIKVENISTPYAYFAAGAQLVPDGGNGPAPAFPGESFTVNFHAGKSHKLSFASMYGASNDMFYSTDENGIGLFSGSTALEGDITNMIGLWDAGTEVNGSGSPGTPESNPVEAVVSAEDNIEVLLAYDGTSMFTLTVNVKPGSATPLSPIAWVVHSSGQKPIFMEGALDYGNGLEDLAETGNPGPLSSYLESMSGYASPIAPVVWATHKKGQKPIFKEGKVQYGNGLETLAETGDPSLVYNSLQSEGFASGVQAIPDGGDSPAPIFPGESYTFTVEANVGEYLSFASMLGASNDEFFAPSEMGIQLFNGNTPISGDVSNLVMLWDAGTEVNEYPGAGIHQGPGDDIEENNPVMKLSDGFMWPSAPQAIKVTITLN